MLINSRPPDRRRMIHELSDLLNTPAEYLRPPTYGYRIGSLVVNRDGTITTDSPQVIATIRPFLLERGYLPDEASATSTAPPQAVMHRSRMEICAPLGSITVRQLKILIQILYCRQHILNRMLGTTRVSIDTDYVKHLDTAVPGDVSSFVADFTRAIEGGQVCGVKLSEERITLDFPDGRQDFDRMPVYSDLLRRTVEMACSIRRVQLTQQIPDSDKYSARAFLLRLGYTGREHRTARQVLLNHLDGYAAFRLEADMEAHKARLAALRRREDS